jgi:hypothetical protein
MTDDKKTAPADPAANAGPADILAFAPDSQKAKRYRAPRADRHAATLALKRALSRRLTRSLKRRDAIVLLIQAPSASWVGPLHDAVRDLFGSARSIDYSASPRDSTHGGDLLYFARCEVDARGRPDLSGGVLPAHLARGGAAIGIAPDPALLPAQMLAAADATVTVLPLTGRDLARVVRTTTGAARCPRIDDRLAASLDPTQIASAVRAGDRPSVCVLRLTALATRDAAALPSDAPPLEDLAGYGDAMTWGMALKADVDALRADPASLSLDSITRSLLLAGPPGTGKTLFAAALARSCGIPLIATSYGEWQAGDAHLGIVMQRMRDAFFAARDAARPHGAVLFIDELDSLPGRDYAAGDRHASWWASIVNALLTLSERGSAARRGVALIGATNFSDRIDPALTRAGRFDRVVTLAPPDAATFAAMLRTHLGADLADVDLVGLARLTPGRTGADAAQFIREARAMARRASRSLAVSDLAAAMLPAETRSLAQLARIARHEAAHAVVGHLLGAQSVASVSLTAPGADGVARFATDTSAPLTRAALEAMVITCLAGRAVDEADGAPDAGSGGGPGSDLATATTLLAAMHASFGLGATLITIGGGPEDMADLLRFDAALRATVEGDLQSLYAEAQALVAANNGAIDAVAAALVQRRFLGGDEVRALIRRPRGAPRRPTARRTP